MEKAKEFILKFLDKEAECWIRLNSNDLNTFNNCVKELYSMAIDDLEEGLGIYEEKELIEEDDPKMYKPRHLYKLSAYKNKIHGDIWVAYVSIKNPISEPNESIISDGFIMSEIENEFKIIGTIWIALNNLTMNVIGWKGNIYNPSDLDIKKRGKFVSTERYSEPDNRDSFSLNEYLNDK